MPADLAIVILNYRTPEMTADCLRSLAPEAAALSGLQAIVVDNASGDGSAEAISATISENGWQWATVLPLPTNGGFSAGNNAAIRRVLAQPSPPRWIMLLNSDTLVRPGACAELIRVGESHPAAGLIGPRLEWPDGQPQVSCFRNISPLTELLAAAATGPVTRLFRRQDVPIPQPDDATDIQWLSFACVLIRSKVVDRIGLMDEGYFMYYEDVDYCRRARAAGWGMFFAAHACVVHLQGASSLVNSAERSLSRRPKYYYASRSRYFAKFYGIPGLWAANVLWHVGRSISWLREIVRNKSPHTCAREASDIWTEYSSPLGTRRASGTVSQ